MTFPKLRILLIEDESDLAANVVDYFESLGHTVDYAADGASGVSLALSESFDVVVLDVGLPKLDGWEVCARIRAEASRHVAVLMLTARDALADKLRGFDAGADDYLTKPFALDELHARCQALARRRELHRGHVLVIGSLRVDTRKREAVRAGVPLPLTKKGFDILHALAEAYPAAVTRSELIARIWGEDWPDSDALRSHVYALRQELDRAFERPMLKTIHGIGFQLEADE
ncbi:MAG TPA: response regulator transcription factor [Thermoanaerobaculia bacterium]|nr:response regulator transcription factor [Thermoanaerobaculia bacterium]